VAESWVVGQLSRGLLVVGKLFNSLLREHTNTLYFIFGYHWRFIPAEPIAPSAPRLALKMPPTAPPRRTMRAPCDAELGAASHVTLFGLLLSERPKKFV